MVVGGWWEGWVVVVEWGQWDRVSWHCQSSAWQKTRSQTIAGILSRRLKVSILLSVSRHGAFDWWRFRRGALQAGVSLLSFVYTCGLWINSVRSGRGYSWGVLGLPNNSPVVIVCNVCMEQDDWIVEICPQGSLMGVVTSAWDPNDSQSQLAFLGLFVFWIASQRLTDLCLASAIWNAFFLDKKSWSSNLLMWLITSMHFFLENWRSTG